MQQSTPLFLGAVLLLSVACLGAGEPAESEDAPPTHKAAASCADGDPDACFEDGQAARAAGDLGAAAGAYKRSCDLGGVGACVNLGLLYQHGDGVPQDASKAAKLFELGCDRGDEIGCGNLGSLYLQGLGVPVDYDRALALLATGCDGGDGSSCGNLGIATYSGMGMDKDVPLATEHWRKGCDLGHGQSCFNLSRLLATGDGADLPRAKALREKACQLGFQEACE